MTNTLNRYCVCPLLPPYSFSDTTLKSIMSEPIQDTKELKKQNYSEAHCEDLAHKLRMSMNILWVQREHR